MQGICSTSSPNTWYLLPNTWSTYVPYLRAVLHARMGQVLKSSQTTASAGIMQTAAATALDPALLSIAVAHSLQASSNACVPGGGWGLSCIQDGC